MEGLQGGLGTNVLQSNFLFSLPKKRVIKAVNDMRMSKEIFFLDELYL